MLILVAAVIALPCQAEDRFTLGLEGLALTLDSERPEVPGARDLELKHAEPASHPDGYALVYESAVTPTSEHEFTLALWNAPMGRVHHAMAADQAMIGREGLVGGGRMLGLGMATTALGDGSKGGLSRLMGGERWHEMSVKHKIKAGVEASFVAALLYYLTQYAD
jgi:hypothetical protein